MKLLIFGYKLQHKTLPAYFSNLNWHRFHIFIIMTQEIVIYYAQRESTMNLQSIMFVMKS